MNGEVIHHLPGAIYVVDQGRPMRTVASASHIQQVFVPKSSLGLSDDSRVSETVVDTAQSVGALLHAAMDRVFAAFNRDCRSLEFDLVDGFLALLKVNLGVPPQREDVRRHVRTELVKRIILYAERLQKKVVCVSVHPKIGPKLPSGLHLAHAVIGSGSKNLMPAISGSFEGLEDEAGEPKRDTQFKRVRCQ